MNWQYDIHEAQNTCEAQDVSALYRAVLHSIAIVNPTPPQPPPKPARPAWQTPLGASLLGPNFYDGPR